MEESTERRLFHRVPFDHSATLTQNGTSYPCQLKDISLKGALVSFPSETEFEAESEASLTFFLGHDRHKINMASKIVHQEEGSVGLYCVHIDVESISLLRRTIELNTGDSTLLNRELATLIEQHSQQA
ncbi:PilZ domain-containing protein [Pleionea sp. CnH1-48]|uniref:PilZ domain-containing protein n=1 Tax=Pleionea sp. CnH1-48 TaxID=2954494 RepID=UPI0020986555|nr:PilZ domain-containing protein [Pleionea sp. CnH1-48]MCO7225721.1 PilZ domain-containing protein [Pleionea sp. CnH1-48]